MIRHSSNILSRSQFPLRHAERSRWYDDAALSGSAIVTVELIPDPLDHFHHSLVRHCTGIKVLPARTAPGFNVDIRDVEILEVQVTFH